jgi:competence protein ComEC
MKKIIILLTLCSFAALGILFAYQYSKFYDGKLHIVVCDVGQGDAIFIRTPNGSDVLIDGGPDNSVLSCLSKHMPFWDRTLEVVILTHPDSDHSLGIIDVIKRYKLIHFYTSKVEAETVIYEELLKTIRDHKVNIQYIWQGDQLTFEDSLTMKALWPSFEWKGSKTNSFSVIELLTYKNFTALFTGDSDAEQMNQISGLAGNIDFLKVPHHGSRFGLTQEVIDFLSPEVAAISVGKNNRYGHPTRFVLDLLKSANIKIMRTDQVGDIEVTSDGKTFQIRSRIRSE